MIAIIIEDELFTAQNLQKAISRVNPGIQVVAVYKSGKEAISGLKRIQPELVFLDVELEGPMTGIEVLESLQDYNFKVVFTTSYEKYAIPAFRLNAVHYLLKPYSDEELEEAIKRVNAISISDQKKKINGLHKTTDFLNHKTDHLSFPDNKGNYIVTNIQNIVSLNTEGSYVHIITTGNDKLTTTNISLNDYEIMLHPRGFIRAHQSWLVNTSHILKYLKPSRFTKKSSGAGGFLLIRNDQKIPVARTKMSVVKQALNIV